VTGSAADVADGLALAARLDEPPDVILLDTFPADADARIARTSCWGRFGPAAADLHFPKRSRFTF
jgi:hypothetical protein